MEDAHTLIDSFNGSTQKAFFGIYDGHGGKQAADYAAQHVHENFTHALKKDGDIASAWKNAMRTTDDQLKENEIIFSGSTAVCCYIDKEAKTDSRDGVIYVSNVGDARAVLGIRNQENTFAVKELSHDHKVTDRDEIDRINSSGGFVSQNRVNGILGVSRALGDHLLKELVISDPFMTTTDIANGVEFVVLGCDGIFDVLTNDQVVQIAAKSLNESLTNGKTPMQAANLAAKKLLASALEAFTTDNVSVIVIIL
ncbi:Protein phosphatase [Carpediemonas membranifera]|uniref:Protein phosphatase n=1 Tax=Carpediemonas membranifera TaxID=201153 RepID=A0A8J6B2S8_9EUKA|nr:Protein phosphatase [Carpediemonas membranifera]|eukprot:KAG9391709.1 Protein phosphatase [Carpediemonas membranifera]